MLLDGRSLAERIEAELRPRAEFLVAAGHAAPQLVAVSPSREDAALYARLKAAASERVGIDFREVVLPPGSTTADALARIDALNADARVHGILIQHPLPPPLNARACFDRIAPDKDIDAVGTIALGRLLAGEQGRLPATVAGTMRLLAANRIRIGGARAVVAGQGPLFALPMALAMLRLGAEVTLCAGPPDLLRPLVRRAELIVTGLAQPRAIPADWLPDGAVVVDAGYFNEGGVGDVDLEPARHRLAAYAPVPGGVGPMTVAMLLEATVDAAEATALA